jgi:hypothetical protein
MIEYPEILHSSRAPRQRCIAFEKLDGSNIRIKYTRKRGFCQFGSRTQMLEESHPILGGAIVYFSNNLAEKCEKIIAKNWSNEREVMLFGEWFGPNSFAGWHEMSDIQAGTMKFVLFDCMISHKCRKFLLPKDFIKIFGDAVEIPRVMYEGNLNEQLIAEVREGRYDVSEGLICKGCERTGAAAGNVWMAKIKTNAYFERLKAKFGEEGFAKYW